MYMAGGWRAEREPEIAKPSGFDLGRAVIQTVTVAALTFACVAGVATTGLGPPDAELQASR